MKLRNIATPVVAAGALLGLLTASTPAKATGQHINGYEVTYLYDSGTFHTWDNINVVGPYGTEYLTVRCAPYEWQSTGPNSREWVNEIARAWCFGG